MLIKYRKIYLNSWGSVVSPFTFAGWLLIWCIVRIYTMDILLIICFASPLAKARNFEICKLLMLCSSSLLSFKIQLREGDACIELNKNQGEKYLILGLPGL